MNPETKTITLTGVYRYTTKKDGSPLINAKGKPYTSVRVKCVEYGDKLISGFGNPLNANWKVGDKVEVVVTEKGEYLNFDMPEKPKEFVASNAEIKNILNLRVIPMLTEILERLPKKGEKIKYPEMDETNDVSGLDDREVPPDAFDELALQ